MTRTRLVVAFLVLLARPLAAAEPQPSAAPADRGALEQVVAAGVVTAPETPSFAAYARDLGVAVTEWVFDRLSRLAPGMDALVVEIARVGAGVVFAVALVLLGVLLARVLRDQLARRTPPEAPVTMVADVAGAERPRGDGAAELRRRLAAGDVAGACEALWWWLARALAGDAVESSWTCRELLERTGRRDLTAPVRRLERMVYGTAAPAVDDVRRLWHELEEAVG